jgi:hypothetical protein
MTELISFSFVFNRILEINEDLPRVLKTLSMGTRAPGRAQRPRAALSREHRPLLQPRRSRGRALLVRGVLAAALRQVHLVASASISPLPHPPGRL